MRHSFRHLPSSLLAAAVLCNAAAFAEPLVPSETEPSAPSKPASVDAQVEQAQSRAAAAYEKYEGGDFEGAVALYLEAYAASPVAAILYNVAKIYDVQLKDAELAASFYRRYVADPGADVELVHQANARLRTLRELERAKAVAAGPPRPSNTTASEAPRNSAQPLPAESNAATSSVWTAANTTSLALGTLGLVGVTLGVIEGLAALSDADEANAACDGNFCRSQAGVDAAKDASGHANLSTAGFVSGAALLGAGLTVFLLWGGSEQAGSSNLGLRPSIGLRSATLSFSGTFQ